MKNYILMGLKCFIISSLLFILIFEFYLYKVEGFEKCLNIECFLKNFKCKYIYFISVYFLVSIVSTCLNYYFQNYSKVKFIVLYISIMYSFGFLVFLSNKLFFNIWSEYNFFERMELFFTHYTFDFLLKYLFEILLFVLVEVFIRKSKF